MVGVVLCLLSICRIVGYEINGLVMVYPHVGLVASWRTPNAPVNAPARSVKHGSLSSSFYAVIFLLKLPCRAAWRLIENVWFVII